MSPRPVKHGPAIGAALFLLIVIAAIIFVVKLRFEPPEEYYIFGALGGLLLIFLVWRIRHSIKKRRIAKQPKPRPRTHIASPGDNLDLRRASTPAEAIHEKFMHANIHEKQEPGDMPRSYSPTLETHLRKMTSDSSSGTLDGSYQSAASSRRSPPSKSQLMEYNEGRQTGFVIENAIKPILVSILCLVLLAVWSFLFITDWERIVPLREGRTDLYLPVAGAIALVLAISQFFVYRWRYIKKHFVIQVIYDKVSVSRPYNKWLRLNGTTQNHDVWRVRPLSYEKRTFLQQWGYFIRGVRKTRHVKIDVEGKDDDQYLHDLPYVIDPERLDQAIDNNKRAWLEYYSLHG